MDLLSKIGYIAMIIDHLGKVFFPNYIIFQIVGRIAYPIFAYKLSIGINRSKNILFFIYRVIFTGIISQYFYMTTLRENSLNICFTLGLGIILSELIKNYSKNKLIYIFIIIMILIISTEGIVEYGIYGVGLIYIFTKIDILTDNIITLLFYIIVITIYTYLCVVFYNWNIVQMHSIMAIPIVVFINKFNLNILTNKVNKYSHYLIYPVHFIIIYAVKILI